MIGNSGRNAGYSLLEVLIAMTILGVGLLGFISLYGTGFKALQSSSARTAALRLAQDKMESLRHFSPLSTPDPDPTDSPEAGMVRTWSIVASKNNSNTWVITVEVAWTNQEGQDKKVLLKSFRSP